jgi:exosortase E/protease (VPEID-CTERM system)
MFSQRTTFVGAEMTSVSSIDAESTGLRTSPSGSRIFLWIGLVLLLVAELIILTLPFDPSGNLAQEGFWAGAMYAAQLGIRPTFITTVLAAIFFSWPVLRQEFCRILDESPDRIISARWFTAHLVLLALLILGTRAHATRLKSVAAWEGWLLLCIVVSLAALATWLFSALPPRFYVRWIARSRSALLTAAGVGLAAYGLGNWMQELWWLLQRSTFQMVALILQLLGQAAVNHPEKLVIGTSRFSVYIAPRCSGLEGIGLMCAFVSAYLLSCREELSFPWALLLLPVGAISIWLLNSARIAALIFIGGWNQDVALKGFHSAAGWIFFNVVAVGLVWTSSQSQLFVKLPESQTVANPARGYLLPLIVFFASSLFARMLAPQFFLQAVAVPVLATLWYYRSTLLSLQWKPSWFSILEGAGVFVVTAVASSSIPGNVSVGTALQHLSNPAAGGLLVLGLAGGGVAVPIAQELAFRGYLARKLVASDFEDVPFNQFTWLSFLGSSILFGVTEPNWLPAILAGTIFALVMYRRGLLTDAIIAHLCSSSLLFLFAAATGKWSLLG